MSKKKTKSWIHTKSENSITQLKEIVSRIDKDLHPQKVERYCEPFPKFEGISVADVLSNKKSIELDILNEHMAEKIEQVNLNFVLFDIIRLAPEQNIIHDITWLTDGVLSDYIDVALGNKKIEFFAFYLPSKIQEIQDYLIPYLKKINSFSEKIAIIQEAIENSRKEKFLVSNILLITVTESIVRELCKFIYQMQNPLFSNETVEEFVCKKFNSLDTLISKAKWKNDYPIKLIEAITLYKDISDDNLVYWKTKWDNHLKANKKIKQITNSFSEILKVTDKSNEEYLRSQITQYLESLEKLMSDLLPDKDFQIKINVSVMLDFLVRKYKDDRNLTIHGNFETLNHKWKNYINFSALLKVFNVYKLYMGYYSSENNRC